LPGLASQPEWYLIFQTKEENEPVNFSPYQSTIQLINQSTIQLTTQPYSSS